MKLTTERLDELAAQLGGSDSEWWDCEEESRALIEAARLPVALDECEGLIGALNERDQGGWGGPVVYRFEPSPRGEQGPYGAKVSPPEDEDGLRSIYGYGSTLLAAVLALYDALRERER